MVQLLLLRLFVFSQLSNFHTQHYHLQTLGPLILYFPSDYTWLIPVSPDPSQLLMPLICAWVSLPPPH